MCLGLLRVPWWSGRSIDFKRQRDTVIDTPYWSQQFLIRTMLPYAGTHAQPLGPALSARRNDP